jgi:hypothetical protein
MADRIPIEPFDDDEETRGQPLRPAGIEEAMRPLSAMLGEEVFVFVRDDMNAGDVAIPLVPIAARELVRILPALVKGRPAVTLVSDGHMSHAVTVLEARDDRLVFVDPWNTSSFLQEGRNIAAVKARTEGGGKYSVTPEELSRVIVAEGVAGLGSTPGLVTSPAWDEFRRSDFYTRFGLRPDGDPVSVHDGFAHPHKPGGFGEHVDLGFEVDAAERLRAGVIEVGQKWLLGPGRRFGMGMLKRFVMAMIPPALNLSTLGVDADPHLPSPDLHMAGALVDALASLEAGRPPRASARLDRLGPVFEVMAGRSEQALRPLIFDTIRAVSRGGVLLMRIERRA